MPAPATPNINEVDFCAKMASAMGTLFAVQRDRCPFHEVRIEGAGSALGVNKRKDLRFLDHNQKILLTGEAKLPGGPSAFDEEVVGDASAKAEHAVVRYFFTWDVNRFVLWDRSKWNVPMIERRVKVWDLRMNLGTSRDVARPETLRFIEDKFLPDLIADLSDIVTGRRTDWSLPADDLFLRSLESHLDWPVALLREHLHTHADADKTFDRKLQDWMTGQDRPFLRNQPEAWREAVDNAARTLAYVWTNRFIFYKALKARFPELPKLELAGTVTTASHALKRLNELFRRASDVSGDYETLLFPEKQDWANDEVFVPGGSVDAWRGFLRGIDAVDFRAVPADVVGLIFQKLVSPEERHRLGQHFTGPEPVDLINSFCIRRPDAKVLDPACGSGSFLVRAYYRKHAMNDGLAHARLLTDLFGCDIATYPAHLATLNLAAREINDEANYPRIARDNFFDVVPGRAFCELPTGPDHKRVEVLLPPLDAVDGNPPYVRQEKVDKADKVKNALRVAEAFPDVRLTGRADLHCYFWPHATRFLKEGSYFGFLTSGQWLDVDYGFALQRWILRNFKVVAILESANERWFPDARVKTCVTILQRCSDAKAREANRVRFVRFEQRLQDLIGTIASGQVGTEAEQIEAQRQRDVDRLRDEIESATQPTHDERWRLLLKPQSELWAEGVRASRVLHDVPADADGDDDDAEDDPADDADAPAVDATGQHRIGDADTAHDYAAGKWGRYLRAPDLYFELTGRFADRFVPLGEIVELRRGITSGCDAFFMPKDVTADVLAQADTDAAFRKRVGVSRTDVASGHLKVIKDGAGTLHPIEAEYVRPEVHSLMKVDRPTVRAKDLDRVVLMAGKPLTALRGTHAGRYIKYGETATYASKKSKAVPVPQRSTCAARPRWYDLTPLAAPTTAFWAKGSQYRHIVVHNRDHLIGNCRVNCIVPREGSTWDELAFVALLNSTLVALWSQFYGRYTGTEGTLELMVLDLNLVAVPDPNGMTTSVRDRLRAAFKAMSKRTVGPLCEEALMDCHSYELARERSARPLALSRELQQADRRELDDAVFELLGIESAAERKKLVDRLHAETAAHFRAIRVTEIQKMEDRAKGGKTAFAADEQAADAWDAADLDDLVPLADWTSQQTSGTAAVKLDLPEQRPVRRGDDMYDESTVYFGKRSAAHVVCPGRGSAELVARIADLGVSGEVRVPKADNASIKLLDRLNARHAKAVARLTELAASRSGDAQQQEQIVAVLTRWFVQGRPGVAEGKAEGDPPVAY